MARDTDRSLRNQVIYQVFIRNYGHEGTFKAVERDLDRIRALGTDIVYLMPIHPIGEKNRKGSLGSPYAIQDYRAVNPEFGTLEDFIRLTDAIRNKGMRSMIDVVYNHTSPDSVLSQEHPEWFYHREDGSFGNRVGDWTDVIDLDYSDRGLWDYQIETLKYWAKFVDGFRCDVAPLVPIDFWIKAREMVASVRPDCIWMAESVEPGFIRLLRESGVSALSDGEIFEAFDISYDYDIYADQVAFLTEKAPLSKYIEALNRQETTYPGNYVKAHFLENHDQTRARFYSRDYRALVNMTAFLFFLKGITFIYAGQEYGKTHLPSLFDKDTVELMPEDGVDLTELIKKLSSIKKEALFTDSAFTSEAQENDICVCVHKGRKNGAAVGVFSLKGHAGNATVMLPDGVYENRIDKKKHEIYRNTVFCDGNPMIFTDV